MAIGCLYEIKSRLLFADVHQRRRDPHVECGEIYTSKVQKYVHFKLQQSERFDV